MSMQTEHACWPTAFLNVKKLHPDAKIPTRNNPTDAGLDLYANETVTLMPRSFEVEGCDERLDALAEDKARAIVSTGIAIEFPPGYGFFIHDRSGLSAKFGVHRVAGVADEAYRGEIKVALINLGHRSYTIKKGDRIAQGVLMPIALPIVREVETLSETSRGVQGFGSSGK